MRIRITPMDWRLSLAALCSGGLLLSVGCRSDELQEPGTSTQITRPPALAVAPTGGLVGEWKLDETGGTVAHDTKNGFDATVAGGATFVAGKIDNGINLNNGTAGTGGKYVEMPSNTTLDNVQEGDYTISAWVNAASVPPDQTMENHHWAIVVKAGWHMGLVYQQDQRFSMRHYLSGNVLRTANSSATYAPNGWHHLAGVVSKTSGTVTLYVDGAAAGSNTFVAGTGSREFDATRFRIGKAASNWALDGKVDQVRIYNRALSAAEVTELFNETASANAKLAVGLTGLTADDFGALPSAASHYTATIVIPNNNAGDGKNIHTVLAEAERLDMTLALRLSGSLGQYTNTVGTCKEYDPDKFRVALDRFTGEEHQDLRDALNSRRAIVYVIDEPWIDDYCGSISEVDVRAMGQMIKTRWPGAITAVRAPGDKMKDGWPDNDPQPQIGFNFWSTIDYGWAQFNHNAAVRDTTPAMFYAHNKDLLDDVNLGMIAGINVWNGGNKTCWSQPDGRFGLIHGSDALPESEKGDFVNCPSTEPANSEVWVASPQLLRSAVNAAAADDDIPLFIGWTHVVAGEQQSWGVMYEEERRGDFVNAFTHWVTTGNARTTGHGWRQAK